MRKHREGTWSVSDSTSVDICRLYQWRPLPIKIVAANMASLLRRAAQQGCRILTSNVAIRQRTVQPACLISTSKKNKDAATLNETIQTKPEVQATEDDPNWISYGYSLTDRDEDHFTHKMMMFLYITVGMCGLGFFFAYFPDYRNRDWTRREAYLELARRRSAGLPLIDKDLIPAEKMEAMLPSDEELGDTEIII